jgi:hypothetical protein
VWVGGCACGGCVAVVMEVMLQVSAIATRSCICLVLSSCSNVRESEVVCVCAPAGSISLTIQNTLAL